MLLAVEDSSEHCLFVSDRLWPGNNRADESVGRHSQRKFVCKILTPRNRSRGIVMVSPKPCHQRNVGEATAKRSWLYDVAVQPLLSFQESSAPGFPYGDFSRHSRFAPITIRVDDVVGFPASGLDLSIASSPRKTGVRLNAKPDNGGRFAMTHPKTQP